jgi:hypothetical protein
MGKLQRQKTLQATACLTCTVVVHLDGCGASAFRGGRLPHQVPGSLHQMTKTGYAESKITVGDFYLHYDGCKTGRQAPN